MADAVCDLFAARFRTQDGGPQFVPMRQGTPPNGVRLICGADGKSSQMEDYHSKTAPPASGAC